MDTQDPQENQTQNAPSATATAPPPDPSSSIRRPPPSSDELEEQRRAQEDRREQRDAVRAAEAIGSGDAKATLSEDAARSATEWFLGIEEVPTTYTLKVDVGSPEQERWYSWTLQSINAETLKHCREAATQGTRLQRRAARAGGAPAEVNGEEMNARILIAGSLDPDFREIARQRGAPEHPDPDFNALMLLRQRLIHKPGLIDQLASEVLALSGYDDEAIRENAAGKA